MRWIFQSQIFRILIQMKRLKQINKFKLFIEIKVFYLKNLKIMSKHLQLIMKVIEVCNNMRIEINQYKEWIIKY